MLKNKTIAVVVPVFNEEKLIGRVVETMPDFVDMIIVVDDKSKDRTLEIVEDYINRSERKILLIKHEKNSGVGASIISGYKEAIKQRIDIAVVMAGDAQMDPANLPDLLEPLINGKADYAKGNRLFTGEAWRIIPKVRYLGNSFLSLFTKIASGYWKIADSQSGYTAISLNTLKKLESSGMFETIYPRYGMPNDILVCLNVINARVVDVPVNPIYNIGEKSGIRLAKVIPAISFLLLRRFFWRMKEKYVIRDFHPLVFFYMCGILLFFPGLLFGFCLFAIRMIKGPIAPTSALFAVFLTISGLQLLLFGMLFDMESNRNAK